MSRSLCFIPARGGSKRIPRKNLALLAGKPLLQYSIEVALQCGVFDDVVVSSEDMEILDLAQRCGATADARPAALAADTVRFVEVLAEFLNRDSRRFDFVTGMQPTSPFRTTEDVVGGFEMLREQNAFVISVTEYPTAPQLALDFATDGVTLLMREPATYQRSTQSQALGRAFHPNGAFYMAPTEKFLEHKTFFGSPLLGYAMPRERSFDIDEPYQLAIAECMMRRLTRDV